MGSELKSAARSGALGAAILGLGAYQLTDVREYSWATVYLTPFGFVFGLLGRAVQVIGLGMVGALSLPFAALQSAPVMLVFAPFNLAVGAVCLGESARVLRGGTSNGVKEVPYAWAAALPIAIATVLFPVQFRQHDFEAVVAPIWARAGDIMWFPTLVLVTLPLSIFAFSRWRSANRPAV